MEVRECRCSAPEREGINRTRPGSEPVGVEEERRRVIPVIQALAREFPGQPDLRGHLRRNLTIAQEALDAGAHIINDAWAVCAYLELRQVVAREGARMILMHNRSNPASVEVRSQLDNAASGPSTQT